MYHCIRLTIVLCLTAVLAGCANLIPQKLTTDYVSPSQMDEMITTQYQSLGFDQLSTQKTLYGDMYQTFTFAFDPSLTGQRLDNQIANYTKYDLYQQSYQLQQSSNVISRSVSLCFLQSSESAITWDTDVSGLQYHVRQWGSGRYALSSGQMLEFGDQPVLAITITNPSPHLIQFSGSADCGPISPYGYARWYVTRPVIDQINLGHQYRSQSGSSVLNPYISLDSDVVNTSTFMTEEIAYPLGTTISLDASGAIMSGVVMSSGIMTDVIVQSGWKINTDGRSTGTYTIVLQDKRGGLYHIPLTLYDRISLTSVSVAPDLIDRGYYHGLKTQSPGLAIDTKATNTLLSQQYSGVKIADSLWFVDCYDASCFAIDTKIQSGQSVRTVTVVDQFGITGSIDLNFTMGAIKPSLRKVTIRGEGINMLTHGVWDNAIQVDYENITGALLQYRTCQWKPEQDLTAQLTRTSQTDQYNNRSNRIEDILFACDTPIIEQSFVSSTTRYRDPTTIDLAIPRALQSSKAFVVSHSQKPNITQLFVQSQIGIYIKQGATQAHVWLFDLATGAPITGEIRMQTYQFALASGWSQGSSFTASTWPYVMDTTQWGEMTALTVQRGDDWGFVTLGGRSNQTSLWTQDRSISLQSSISVGDVSDSAMIQTWGSNPSSRVYLYTDRGLYKPGDQLFIAGWSRAMSDIGQGSPSISGSVYIKVVQASDEGTMLAELTGIRLDEYGGFHGSVVIPDSAPLGDYIVMVTDPYEATYTQIIKINEYQKPSFYINQDIAWKGDEYRMTIKPEYYFGSSIASWQFRTDWSIVPKDRGRWWRDDTTTQDYYYDVRLEYRSNTTSLAGTVAGGGVDLPVSRTLFERAQLPSDPVTIKVSTAVTDAASQETHVVSEYHTVAPVVSVGLGGSIYEWYYEQTIKQLKPISYQLSGSRDSVDRVTYTWYHTDWSTQTMNKGVDGSLYYNGTYYDAVGSGIINSRQTTIPVSIIDTPGDWLLVVQAWDKNNQEIGHNEKSIWYAGGDAYNFGSMNNNYTLTVSIDQKQYDDQEPIPVNITPYIKGATVMVTVEQGDRIVDSYMMVLDGRQITIPAKRSYYPSAMISVTQIAGSNLLNQQSSSKFRQEPRMWQGYSQVKINQDLFTLNLDISTDKQTYQPGEQVTLTIKTTDHRGKPVDARLSVGVVDKSLNDLYAYFKSPLSDFFLSIGTTITNYTNMKWIYQGLKVFTKEGSKGGGGGGRNPLGFLRQSFDDVAYWRGGVYTKDGVWTNTFMLPDNLTTWTIDVVGITKDSRVGTQTKDIIASKDLIIQANLPLYLTIGDRIEVPMSVLGLTDAVNELRRKDVALSGSIMTNDGQIMARITHDMILNESMLIPIQIDPQWYRYQSIIIELDARVGSYRDAIRQSIPLRADGLTQRQSKTVIAKDGSLAFPISAQAISAQTQLHIGQTPTISLGTQFDYLIGYPYGGTEQLASSIDALLTARALTKDGLFAGVFSGDMVVSEYRTPFTVSGAVAEAKTKIRSLQQGQGGFAYWDGGQVDYPLSIYVYATILKHPQLSIGYESKLTSLERYLESNGGAANPDQYLYYLYYKAQYRGGVNLTQVKQLVERDATAHVAPVLLGAAIASKLGDRELAQSWFERLSLDDFDGRQTEYGPLYPLLTPRSALLIYQSLIDGLSPRAAQLHQELIVSLVRQRGSDGLRGYSTIDNVAALKTLSSYHSSTRTDVGCEVTIDGQRQRYTIGTGKSQILTLTGVAGEQSRVERNCDDMIVVDAVTSSVMTTISESDLSSKDVEYLRRSLPGSLQPGSMSHAIAQFKITQAAPHTAIALYIPSTYKLSDIINKKSTGYELPFTVEGARSCHPDHYEVRFDQLFLYYDNLEPNQSCRITIPVLRAYTGETTAMPSKLRQMYDDSVYASVLPTIQ